MPRGKAEQAEVIIPKLREVVVELGRGKTVVDRTAGLGETWVRNNATPVGRYPAGVARYRVP